MHSKFSEITITIFRKLYLMKLFAIVEGEQKLSLNQTFKEMQNKNSTENTINNISN